MNNDLTFLEKIQLSLTFAFKKGYIVPYLRNDGVHYFNSRTWGNE